MSRQVDLLLILICCGSASNLLVGCTGSSGPDPSVDAGTPDGGISADAGVDNLVEPSDCFTACGELATCTAANGVLVVAGRCDANQLSAEWMEDSFESVEVDGTLNVSASSPTVVFGNVRYVRSSLSLRGPLVDTEVDFPVLEEVGASFSIPAESGVVAFRAHALLAIGGVVDVFGNDQLEVLALPSVDNIAEGVSITGNTVLSTLDLQALQYVGGDFVVDGNSQLATCELEEQLANVNVVGEVILSSNGSEACDGG